MVIGGWKTGGLCGVFAVLVVLWWDGSLLLLMMALAFGRRELQCFGCDLMVMVMVMAMAMFRGARVKHNLLGIADWVFCYFGVLPQMGFLVSCILGYWGLGSIRGEFRLASRILFRFSAV